MEQSRREFLGLLSWIVLTPVTQGKLPKAEVGSVYRGPLRPLAERLAAKIKPELRCYVLSLNESVEDSTNWISNDLGSTLVEMSGRNWEELSAELITRKVRRAIHATYFNPKPGPPEAFIVEMTVFETPWLVPLLGIPLKRLRTRLGSSGTMVLAKERQFRQGSTQLVADCAFCKGM